MVLKGTPEEFAALVAAIQERQVERIDTNSHGNLEKSVTLIEDPLKTIREAVQQAIGGTAGASQDSSLPSSGT